MYPTATDVLVAQARARHAELNERVQSDRETNDQLYVTLAGLVPYGQIQNLPRALVRAIRIWARA